MWRYHSAPPPTLDVIDALVQLCRCLESLDLDQALRDDVDHVVHAVPLVLHRQAGCLLPALRTDRNVQRFRRAIGLQNAGSIDVDAHTVRKHMELLL